MRENARVTYGVANHVELADMAECKMCGKPIFFNGRNWDHVGQRVRHPAIVDRNGSYQKASISWRFVSPDEVDFRAG